MAKWSRGRSDLLEERPRAIVTLLPAPEAVMRLGDLLVCRSVLTTDGLAEALAAHQETGRRLGAILLERGLVHRPARA